MDLSFRQLQAIVAIAEERSFTGAGKRLRLSQQSVSALLREAEARLGTELFSRTTRTVEPTTAGETLVPQIRHGLEVIQTAIAAAMRAGKVEPPLILAVTPAVAYGDLQFLLEALDGHGLTAPDIREVWPDEFLTGMRDGTFDVGIGIEIAEIPGTSVTAWRQQRIDLLVASSHPFAAMEEIRVHQLAGATLFMPGEKTNLALRDRMLKAFNDANVQPRLVDAPRVVGPVPIDVERGKAATVWLTGMDERYLPSGLVRVRLCDPETVVTTSLISARHTPDSHPASLGILLQAVSGTSTI